MSHVGGIPLTQFGGQTVGQRIAQDLAEAQQKLGFPVQLTSGYRTAQEQQALQGTGLAAPVGHSLHEQGNAIDLNWNGLKPDQQKALVDYMTSKGYRWGQSFGEPWHFDLQGQLQTPPSTTPTTQPEEKAVSGFDVLDELEGKDEEDKP